jgi:hypothetical protein
MRTDGQTYMMKPIVAFRNFCERPPHKNNDLGGGSHSSRQAVRDSAHRCTSHQTSLNTFVCSGVFHQDGGMADKRPETLASSSTTGSWDRPLLQVTSPSLSSILTYTRRPTAVCPDRHFSEPPLEWLKSIK